MARLKHQIRKRGSWRVEGNIEGKLESNVEGKVEGRIETKVEGKVGKEEWKGRL